MLDTLENGWTRAQASLFMCCSLTLPSPLLHEKAMHALLPQGLKASSTPLGDREDIKRLLTTEPPVSANGQRSIHQGPF